ncbi:hypothetical protein HDU67_000584 [Dinochytrium kinnereticum]|nr:hypothetical protein HDU67_000584 [Dinochytrium kinnereticum]
MLGLVTAAIALIVLALVAHIVLVYLVPRVIQETFRTLELKKLVVMASFSSTINRHEATLLKFTPNGAELRLRMNVLETRLPVPWLRLGLAKPPVITACRLMISSRSAPVALPLARLTLSDPITLTGLSDLWIWQDRIDVEVLDVAVLKAMVRKVSLQNGSTEGLMVKINLEATLQFMGIVLYQNLPLEKVIDVKQNEDLKQEAMDLYNSAKQNGCLPSVVNISGTPRPLAEEYLSSSPTSPMPPTETSRTINPDTPNNERPPLALPGIIFPSSPSHPSKLSALKEALLLEKEPSLLGMETEPLNGDPSIPSSVSDTTVNDISIGDDDIRFDYIQESPPSQNPIISSDPTSKPVTQLLGSFPAFFNDSFQRFLSYSHSRLIGCVDDYLVPVVPFRDPGAEGVFPGIKAIRQPVDTSISGFSTGLSLTFTRPPSLSLRLGMVSFDIQLNGSNVATATVNGIEFRPSSTRADIMIEVIPSMVKKPIRGFLSSARGVLRGALNGTVAGLVNGEWGSGATVLRVMNLQVEDEGGNKIAWVENVLEALDLEHDLDAVRRLGGAAKGAARDVKDGILDVAAGVLVAGGNRCSVIVRRSGAGATTPNPAAGVS